MKKVEVIIERFGGIQPMARKLGHKNSSTVQGWKERGIIPIGRHNEVFNTAKNLGIKISVKDFSAIDVA